MNGITERITVLGQGSRLQMFDLLRKHFLGVTIDQFLKDLREKDHAIRLLAPDGTLAGFSTFALCRALDLRGQQCLLVISGDTIVDQEYRNSPALAKTWITGIRNILNGQGNGTNKAYWLFICSGYRTYKFLPLFFTDFYPHFRNGFPPEIRRWTYQLAAERWGSEFYEESGIVRFKHPQVLRAPFNTIPSKRIQSPHVSFFCQKNPGHVRGDELVCITDLNDANLTAAGRRMAGLPRAPAHEVVR